MTDLRPPAARPPDRVDARVQNIRDGIAGTARSAGSLRLIDVLLFAALAFSGLPFGLGIPGGLDNVVVAAILFVSIFRPPTRDLGRFQALIPILTVGLAYIGLISLFADQADGAADWRLRLVRMVAVVALVMVMASGRIDIRSGVVGYVAAAAVNIPLFYAGLVPAPYGSYLTGIFGDKNVSGLVYCIFGLLLLYYARSTPSRVMIFALSAGAVWLTGSRTSIAAFLCGVAWMLLAPKLPLLGRWVLGIVMYVIVEVTSEDFSQVGVFSGREGSDELRARIDAASQIKVDTSGFFGRGLGEAFVEMDDGRWFFHNSYWTALVEGGWPWVVLVVGVTAVVLIQPFTARPPLVSFYGQGLGIALLICSTRLGEVFLTVPWAVAMAFGLSLLLARRGQGDDATSDAPRHGAAQGRAT